jgi:hypothetical protein
MVARFTDSFDITWRDPGDAASIWAIDRIHFASPLTPLGEDFYAVVVGVSWGTRTAFANGYLFMKDFAPPPTPDEVRELGAKRIWEEKYLPIGREICADVRAPDYDSMTASELVAALPEVFQKAADAFRYPTVIASTFMMPAILMADFCARELGEDGPAHVPATRGHEQETNVRDQRAKALGTPAVVRVNDETPDLGRAVVRIA